MLVLTQAAAGVFLAAAGISLTDGGAIRPMAIAGFGLLIVGLNAAIFHLGQPLKAWRAFLGWRTSWLSREIILFNAFAGAATTALAAFWIPQLAGHVSMLVIAAAVAGVIGVFASAMVYVDTGRQLWSRRIVFGNFFGSALMLGAVLAAAVLGWVGGPLRSALVLAILVQVCLLAWRQIEIRTALRDSTSPVHFGARVVHELLPGVQSSRLALSILCIALASLALADVGKAAAAWASLAAFAALASEIMGRYVFFVAGAGRRMPGGVMP